MSADICTTRDAAKILGVSVTQVQQLVEQGVIEAWKTSGGHRRIPIASVYAYKARHARPGDSVAEHAQTDKRLKVLIVEDSEMQQAIYQGQFDAWKLDVDVSICPNGYQALLDMSSKKPDVLLVDIVMEGMDGYELVKTVLGNNAFADMQIAIISQVSLEELERRGGLPEGVAFFPKPVVFDELRGYVRAHCNRKARAAAQRS